MSLLHYLLLALFVFGVVLVTTWVFIAAAGDEQWADELLAMTWRRRW